MLLNTALSLFTMIYQQSCLDSFWSYALNKQFKKNGRKPLQYSSVFTESPFSLGDKEQMCKNYLFLKDCDSEVPYLTCYSQLTDAEKRKQVFSRGRLTEMFQYKSLDLKLTPGKTLSSTNKQHQLTDSLTNLFLTIHLSLYHFIK